MINAIFGKKIGMTQIFNEEDKLIPVTVIQLSRTRCARSRRRPPTATSRAAGLRRDQGQEGQQTHGRPFRQAGHRATRYLREVRVEDAAEYKAGDQQTVAAFAEVKKVDVTGTSKGKASPAS